MKDQTQASWITSETELRSYIKAPPKTVLQKIQNRIDAATESWLTKSTMLGIATTQPDKTLHVSLHARSKDLIGMEQSRVVIRGQAHYQDDEDANNTRVAQAGMLVMLPGMDSTIRVNGTIAQENRGEEQHLDVAEVYSHCPKAFLRSGLWRERPEVPSFSAEEQQGLGVQSQTFLEQSPFALLATCSEEGQVDLSPRGDPPGFVQVIGENTVWMPDRTGNRIVDSLRNILSGGHVSLMMLIPGSSWGLHIKGKAKLTSDPNLLKASNVKGKTPKVGMVLEVHQTSLQHCSALDESQVWNPNTYVDPNSLLSPGELIVRQMKPEGRLLGLKGKVVDWILNQDAKRNLY